MQAQAQRALVQFAHAVRIDHRQALRALIGFLRIDDAADREHDIVRGHGFAVVEVQIGLEPHEPLSRTFRSELLREGKAYA
jgi:hypothetical protein